MGWNPQRLSTNHRTTETAWDHRMKDGLNWHQRCHSYTHDHNHIVGRRSAWGWFSDYGANTDGYCSSVVVSLCCFIRMIVVTDDLQPTNTNEYRRFSSNKLWLCCKVYTGWRENSDVLSPQTEKNNYQLLLTLLSAPIDLILNYINGTWHRKLNLHKWASGVCGDWNLGILAPSADQVH